MSVRSRTNPKGKTVYIAIAELGRDPVSGNRRQEWIGTYRTRREAERAERAVMAKVDAGTYHVKTPTTVAEWLISWNEDRYRDGLIEPGSYRLYKAVIDKWLLPALGKLSLSRLRPRDVAGVYDRIRQAGASPQRVRYAHTVLHAALERAVRLEHLPSNPAHAARPESRVTPRQAVPWTVDEARAFLLARHDDPLIALWRLALHTGLRRGELMALRWQDVDLDGGVLTLVMNYAPDGDRGWEMKPRTKGGDSRVLMLPPGVVASLREHRDRQAFVRRANAAIWQDGDLVFCRQDGSPINPTTLGRVWNKAVVQAGLPAIRFHDLRHTAATLLRNAGMDLKVLQSYLGHRTFALTADLYSHVTPDLQRDAVERLGEALEG